jgi:hypothetical protein
MLRHLTVKSGRKLLRLLNFGTARFGNCNAWIASTPGAANEMGRWLPSAPIAFSAALGATTARHPDYAGRGPVR